MYKRRSGTYSALECCVCLGYNPGAVFWVPKIPSLSNCGISSSHRDVDVTHATVRTNHTNVILPQQTDVYEMNQQLAIYRLWRVLKVERYERSALGDRVH